MIFTRNVWFVPPDFATHDVTSKKNQSIAYTYKAYGASWDYQIGEILNANTAAWSGLDKRKNCVKIFTVH